MERALPGEYWLILQRVTWGHHFHPTDSQTAQQAGLHIGNDFLTIIPELGVFNHLTGAQVEWARRRGLSWAGECRPSRSGVGFEFEFGGMAQVQAARRELVDSYRADPVQREGSGSRPSSGPVAPVAPPVPRPPVVATQWVWAAGVGGWTASGASYPGRDELLLARVGNEVVALVFWDVAGGLQVAPLGGTPAREFGDTRIQIPDRDGLAGELAGWAWRILGRRVDEGRIAPVIADDVHDDVAPLSAAVAVVLDELGLPDPLRA